MTEIIRLEGSVSELHLVNDEKGAQDKQEDIPDILAFNLDGHIVHFAESEQIPLRNGDLCIVAGCLRKDAIDALVLKHIETGHTAHADTDKIRKLGLGMILVCILVIIVWLAAVLSIYRVTWLSSPSFFVLGLLPLVVSLAAIWFGKKFFIDEVTLIEKAQAKI